MIARVPSNQGQSTLMAIVKIKIVALGTGQKSEEPGAAQLQGYNHNEDDSDNQGNDEDQNCCTGQHTRVIASVPSNQRSQGQFNFEDLIIMRTPVIISVMMKIKIVALGSTRG